MNHLQIITHLRVNGDVFKYLFKNLVDEQARWKPGADRWSLLEVINHLYDEEREDFRKRLAVAGHRSRGLGASARLQRKEIE